MANLFGKNKLKSVAQSINTEEVLPFIDIVKKWHHDYHQGTLRQDKETSREQEYNQNFFKDILSYKEKPTTPFSFEPKATTEKGQLPDAVIGYTDKASDIKNISAVVELKGAAIALDRPQQREGNMSPVQQAFKYKTQYRNCPFVIVSNFWEFRLYRDNLLDYEAWTLDDLVNPDDDYLLFKTWYVLLKSDNFITPKGTSKTEGILSDIRIEQENISKKFYKVYKEARLVLLRDIYSRNETVRDNIDMGVEKAQKIIDRIVFTCFAEDRGLLPDNTLQRVIRDAEQSSFGVSLWQAFKGLFEAIDSGSDKLEIPDGYNGGLFKHDEILDNLRISDDGLKPVVELSKYDFTEDLSVSILGHIFEQSISDLEEIKNKVNVDKNVEAIITQSRRKKDGIFYTPDYIVRYIVDNSLGTYLREHEEEFKEEYKLHGDINDKNYRKREKQAYQKYQYFLQNVKIVDPACGSGAFLVYVFDYLMSENQRVGDILGNNIFSTDEYIRDILKNNIYGVDLNEESVEITKLSLWLKSAQKGKKLTSLDSNIKCGNSLIDDPAVAGNKAFNWQKQFSDVFKNGGFDIVVGNPPYVDSESMVKNGPTARRYITENYSNATGNWDLLVPFIELSLMITKYTGRASYITSNRWLSLDYGTSIRKTILPMLSAVCDCTMENVFESASVSSVVFAINKKGSRDVEIGGLNGGIITKLSTYKKGNKNEELALLNNLSLIFSSALLMISRLVEMASLKATGLFEVIGAFTTGEAYEFIDIIQEGSAHISADNYKLVNTGTIDKYLPLWDTATFNYLKGKYNCPIVSKEAFSRSFPRRFAKLNKPKILITGIRHFESFLDYDNEYLSTKSTVVITGDESDLKWLVAVLNSNFIRFYIRANYLSSSMSGGINFTPDLVRNLPIPSVSERETETLSKYGYAMHELALSLHMVSSHFEVLMNSEFSIENLPLRLKKWWTLDFNDFANALKVKLSLQKKDELLQIFYKYRVECAQFDEQIQKIDQEIDLIVYKLYGLSNEEIKIIEQ